MALPGVTEYRRGNYIYHDGSQFTLGARTPADCAMTVLATVFRVPAAGRAVVDTGSKTLSSDPRRPCPGGDGQIAGRHGRIWRLSEERTVEGQIVRRRRERADSPDDACVVATLHHDRIIGVRGESLETEPMVTARGRVRWQGAHAGPGPWVVVNPPLSP